MKSGRESIFLSVHRNKKNFTYMKSLGSYYTEENVRIRLAKNRSKVKTPKHLSREARLYINISTYVTTGNREGFEHWAKLNNLKEAARTFNYLSENNLLNYEDFRQHVSDVDASVKAADQRIAHITSELSTQKVIQKHCDSYRLCRKVIEDCKSAKNPKEYRSKHLAEYQLHDSLKKELQDLGVTKIPSSEKSRSGLKILNLNKLLPSGKNRNYRKSRKHWISFSKISLCCSMLLKSIQTYFRQNGNLFLSQEINKIALTTQLFSSKSSQGFRPISSQVTPYGAPPEV